MKKLLLTLALASSFTAFAHTQSNKATVVIKDKPLSDAVIVVNILCNSTIDINKFSTPTQKVSLKFNEVACSDIVSIIENYGHSS